MAMMKPEEMQRRFSRVQTTLTELGQDAVICTLGQNFRYLFDIAAEGSERLVLAVIPRDQGPKMIVPSFEVGNFAKNTPLEKGDLIGWEETEDPFAKVTALFEDTKLAQAGVLVSPQMPYTFFSRIHQAVPAATFGDGLSLFEGLRAQKTAHEIELMKKASALSAQGIESGFKILHEGITEQEVASHILQFYVEHGTDKTPFVLVQFGENGADPHALPSPRKLRKGDVVLIDAGMTVEGYWGDITNTTVFGPPSEDFLKAYAAVEAANEAGVQAAKTGATGAAVDQAARAVIEKMGFGQYFNTRTGHGIGLDIHEAPYIISTNRDPLKDGNTHTVEPGVYIPGKFGVRIEDDVLATETGGVRLSSPIRRYWEK